VPFQLRLGPTLLGDLFFLFCPFREMMETLTNFVIRKASSPPSFHTPACTWAHLDEFEVLAALVLPLLNTFLPLYFLSICKFLAIFNPLLFQATYPHRRMTPILFRPFTSPGGFNYPVHVRFCRQAHPHSRVFGPEEGRFPRLFFSSPLFP